MRRRIDLQLFAEGQEPVSAGGGGAEPQGGGQPEPAAGSGQQPQPSGGGNQPDPMAELREQIKQLAVDREEFETLQRRAQLMEQYLQSIGIDPAMLEQMQDGYGQDGFAQTGAYGYGQVNPMDPYGMAQSYEDPRIRQLQEQLEELKLQQEIYELSRKYPDFEQNKDKIMEIAAELGGVPLEVAYRYWKVDNLPPPPDIEKIKQEAIQEYLQGKRQAAQQPSPQGAGGGVPAGPAKPKSLDEADKEALRRLEAAFRAS